jgi:aminopeptidase
VVERERLQAYASVILKVGVVIEPGQRLVIQASLGSAPLARALARGAYAAGAINVDVLWSDPEVTRSRFLDGTPDARGQLTADGATLLQASARGDSIVTIFDEDPQLLDDIPPTDVAEHQQGLAAAMRDHRERTASLAYPWTIVAAPSGAWARRVFPELDEAAAVERLWDAVLATCRIDTPDPIAAWEAHLKELDARRGHLDAQRFDRLRYVGPGTDLTVGLPADHLWLSGRAGGGGFVPNLPTEEVFTSPHRLRADGVIRSTKPLSWYGTMIEGFSLELRDGTVTAARADQGQAALDRILETDEGARRFGEVALVPQSSRVAAQGLVWRNVLFDENDACHIALGTGFPVTLPDGSSRSPDDLLEAGINRSDVHVDFVVGSGELDVSGVLADGSERPILRQGEWAFDV